MCVCICTYINIYIHIYIRIHIYLHIHTYTTLDFVGNVSFLLIIEHLSIFVWNWKVYGGLTLQRVSLFGKYPPILGNLKNI